MADKRGKWTKKDRDAFWKNYNLNVIPIVFKKSLWENLDLSQETLCLWCGGKILKAQYYGVQPTASCCYDYDHFDGNPKNNSINNLFPMHPRCNKEKANKTLSVLARENKNGFANKLNLLRSRGVI